jgi:hypothetical protein
MVTQDPAVDSGRSTLAVSADELTIPAPLAAVVESLAAVRARLQLPC